MAQIAVPVVTSMYADQHHDTFFSLDSKPAYQMSSTMYCMVCTDLGCTESLPALSTLEKQARIQDIRQQASHHYMRVARTGRKGYAHFTFNVTISFIVQSTNTCMHKVVNSHAVA